jgi:hypothetical protein
MFFQGVAGISDHGHETVGEAACLEVFAQQRHQRVPPRLADTVVQRLAAHESKGLAFGRNEKEQAVVVSRFFEMTLREGGVGGRQGFVDRVMGNVEDDVARGPALGLLDGLRDSRVLDLGKEVFGFHGLPASSRTTARGAAAASTKTTATAKSTTAATETSSKSASAEAAETTYRAATTTGVNCGSA